MGASSGAFFRSRAKSRIGRRHPVDIERRMSQERQCKARSKRTGKRCKRAAVPGKSVCYYHGGASTGPRTPEGRERCSLAAMVHGAYVDRVLDEHEQQIYDAFLAEMRQDFELNNSSDEVQVLMAAMAFVQFCRAQQACTEAPSETYARIIRANLKDLKATKLAREGETSSNLNTSPAEWATALLENIRKSEKPKTQGKKASRGKTRNKRQI